MTKDVKARELFDNLVKISMGDGQGVLFWCDRWIDGRAATDFASGLLLTVSTRPKNSTTVAHAMTDNR
jgi:hypothetical protein